MGFWPMRFQCWPLQDAARSAILSEASQVFSPGFAGMGGGRWEGTGLFVHLCFCSLPVMVLPDLSCHTCESPSLSLSVATVCTCLLSRNVSAPLFFKVAESVHTITWHLPCYSWELWEGEERQLHICVFVFCLVMVAAKSQLQYFCIQSLPLSLGLVTVCADHSGRNAEYIPLVLRAAGFVCCKLTFTLLWVLQWAPGSPISVLPLSLLPTSLRYAHFEMFQCEDLSDEFVYWAGNPLFNYSCPTCNFKGYKQEDLSCLYAADITCPNFVSIYIKYPFYSLPFSVCVCLFWSEVGLL